MPVIHFQSIYRRYGLVMCEPLCARPVGALTDLISRRPFAGVLSPRHDEITCPDCLRFLMCVKEPSNA